MTTRHVSQINAVAFIVCLISVASGVAVGLLGIWGLIGSADGTLWRALGTCGTVFAGAVCTSLAIRCFKTNA